MTDQENQSAKDKNKTFRRLLGVGLLAFIVAVGVRIYYQLKDYRQPSIATGTARSPRSITTRRTSTREENGRTLLYMGHGGDGEVLFDVTDHAVPLDEILGGGPQTDGIYALGMPDGEAPRFLDAEEASNLLAPSDRVLGIVIDEEARAYPLGILDRHEIINDQVGGKDVLITWCPLVDGAITFELPEGQTLTFGVSGKLYNANLLMYDHQTKSLWSQITDPPVTGPAIAKQLKLKAIHSVKTRWGAWQSQYPNTSVLNVSTSRPSRFREASYVGYHATDEVGDNRVMFAPKGQDVADLPLQAKAKIIGVVNGEVALAYPVTALPDDGTSIEDEFEGQILKLRYDKSAKKAEATNAAGEAVPAYVGYFFAWYGFYPDATIYDAQ